MDRRTVLAFVLIFLVLVAQTVIQKTFFSSDEPDPTASDSTLVAETPATDDTSSAEEDPAPEHRESLNRSTETSSAVATEAHIDGAADLTSPDQALTVIQNGDETWTTVTTPLYELRISSLGGRITSWLGLDHPSYKGGAVQLIPDEIPAMGLDALFFRHGDLDLGSVTFDYDGPAEIDLGPESGTRSLTLRATTTGGLEIRKIFTFDAETYGVTVDYVLGTVDEDLARRSLELVGTPETFRFSWNQGISPTERVQKMELPSLRAFAKVGDDFHKKKRSDLKKGAEKVQGQYPGTVFYAGLQNRYFGIWGIVPTQDNQAVTGTIYLGGDAETMCQSWEVEVPAVRSSGVDLATARLDLYIGPQEVESLKVYGERLEESVDLGIRWIRPLTKFVLFVMGKMHAVIPNYGVIIIIFSILIKLVFYPLTKTQTESMKKMQELQPKLEALKAKYKDNKEKLNEATMQLYRDEKVNPLAGCMPLLVQMPVFFALYQAFSHTISLRGQPFVLWINDLSQPDALTQLPFAVPFLGSDLNILPLLMGLAMYYQTKVTPTPSAGGQMAAMNTLMPLIMLFFFYNMPSGLVLYWLTNTILQVYQSWKIHKTSAADGGTQAT